MKNENMIQSGLDILRHDARNTDDRSWAKYEEIKRRAEDHVRACGGNWYAIEAGFAREIQDLLGL